MGHSRPLMVSSGVNRKKIMKRIFCIILLVISASSCSTSPTKAYEGPELTKDQISIVYCTSPAIQILAIDNNRKYQGLSHPVRGGCEVHLLPGSHELDLVYYLHSVAGFDGRKSNGITKFTYDFKAGETYSLTARRNTVGAEGSWEPEIRQY